MKRENLKKAAHIDSEIEELKISLDKWELSKSFGGSTTLKVQKELYSLEFFTVDLNDIRFRDIRNLFLKNLNCKIETLENELQKLLSDEK